MIIEDKRHKNMVTFDDLDCGAVFEFENQIYLKLSNSMLSLSKIKINTINLGTNNLFCFSKSVEVIPLKTKLILEE